MSLIDVHRRLLTVDDVAERLGVSRRTVERKIARGELPAFQLGGPRSPVRVDERELEEWLYSELKKRRHRVATRASKMGMFSKARFF
jgi:excisionase family DNA binding protein